MAQYFRDRYIDAVYASPLKRALATARAIAYYHNLQVEEDRDLREIDVGELEGIELETLTNDLSSYVIGFDKGDGSLKLPGGESLTDLYNRAWAVTQRIVQKDHSSAVIVSHYFVTLCIICAALEMPVSGVKLLRVRPASVSILDFNHNGAVLSLFNHTCHLDNPE